MDHFSNDHEDRPNQQKNSHKLCNGKGHLLLILKLKQQHQNIPVEEKPQKAEQMLRLEERKSRLMRVTARESSMKVKHFRLSSFTIEILYQSSPGLSVPRR